MRLFIAVLFTQIVVNNLTRNPEPHFRSNCQRLLNLDELPEQYLACVEKVKESFQSYQREGSGWQLKEVKLVLCL